MEKFVACALFLGVLAGSSALVVPANRDSSSLAELDWWEKTVVYQIYPRSFKDSDGDGIGDLKGITSELEHFTDAGVRTIWLSPIFTSPMVDFGYDISDFYDIHEEYGTMADFEELLEKAHVLGLKVLLDFVPNHASIESEYFIRSEARDPEYDDWFIWADALPDPDNATNRLPPSNWISQFGGTVWEWSEARQQYYLHQFTIQQADFNFRNPAVKEEMINIMTFWFDKGVDGFRLDALPYIFEADPKDHGGRYPNEEYAGNSFLNPDQLGYTTQIYMKDLFENNEIVYEWRQFADKYQQENGGDTRVLLAEAYANVTMTMLYYGDEHGRVGAQFPFNFDFIINLDAESNARDFVYVILKWLTYMPRGSTANWVFGNHDNNRVPSRFRTNMVDGMNSLNMILPGVSVTYQGDEIGMRNGFVSWEDTVDVNAINRGDNETYLQYSRDPARTPFHWNNSTGAGFSTAEKTWLPIAEDYKELNLQNQKEAERSHFKVYQSLARLRDEPTLTHGDYRIQALTQNTLVVVRHLRTYDTYALIFNVGKESDVVDLSVIENLFAPLEVYTSSIHSSRVSGSAVELGEITLEAGEAIVLRGAPRE